MKVLKIAIFCVISLSLIFSLAISAGNVEKGKALFGDPKLGAGTAGVSCNSCHPDGKGLEKAADWKDKDLEKQVNLCIKNALKGKGIDPSSAEMADIVAYLKSLKGKTPGAATPKK